MVRSKEFGHQPLGEPHAGSGHVELKVQGVKVTYDRESKTETSNIDDPAVIDSLIKNNDRKYIHKIINSIKKEAKDVKFRAKPGSIALIIGVAAVIATEGELRHWQDFKPLVKPLESGFRRFNRALKKNKTPGNS